MNMSQNLSVNSRLIEQHNAGDNPAPFNNSISKYVFVEEVLRNHNMFRQRHGAPDLELDERLTEQSEKCAQDLLKVENVEASRFPAVGENIHIIHINDPMYWPKGEYPVHEWYKQKSMVQYGQEPTDNKGLNFSQLVWKNSKQLGVGIARSYNKMVVVCQYMPPGNINGEYVDNVLPEVVQDVEA